MNQFIGQPPEPLKRPASDYADEDDRVFDPPKALDRQVGGSHYKDLVIQPAEYCQRNKLGFLESMAIKYVTRHPMKGGRQDIEKAIHCLEILLEMEYSHVTAGPISANAISDAKVVTGGES